MIMRHLTSLKVVLVAAVVLGLTLASPAADHKFTLAGRDTLYVAGPFTCENLAVYIFYRPQAQLPTQQYLTLEEGLRKGLVKITERPRETVGTLQITNESDLPLFLQIGQLLQGGKQDRTLGVSLVIPPHTDELEIPAFCVEQSRWSGGATFKQEGVFAPTSVRRALNESDQRQVWTEVREYKSQVAAGTARANQGTSEEPSNSSINEQLEGRPYNHAIGPYQDKLSGAIDRIDTPVGMAYAVGDRFRTADIYTSSDLFKKLYPMLLRTAASEALAESVLRGPSPPSQQQLADTIVSAWEGTHSDVQLPAENVLLKMQGDSVLATQLFYQRNLVHTEAITLHPTKPKPPPIRPLPPIIRPSPPVRPLPQPQGQTIHSDRPDLDELWKAH